MLTKDEAVELLEQCWGMENVESRVRSDRKKFLNELIPVIMERVPYHTFDMTILLHLQTMKMTHAPSFGEMIDMCRVGLGGSCLTKNTFVYLLLSALGYSVHICRTLIKQYNSVIPHPVLILKDLEHRGDTHFVDCGMQFPTFSTIPLDFDQESPVYRDSFLEYKFVRKGDKILRMHARGNPTDDTASNDPQASPSASFNKWQQYSVFVVELIDYKNIQDLLTSFTALKQFPSHLKPEAAIFPGGKAVWILDDKLWLENAQGKLECTKLENMDAILEAYSKYFPTIPKSIILQMYALWQHSTSKL